MPTIFTKLQDIEMLIKNTSVNYYLDIQWILPKVAGQDFLRGKVGFDLSNILKGVFIPLHEKVHLDKSQGELPRMQLCNRKSLQSDKSLSVKRFFLQNTRSCDDDISQIGPK